MVAPAGARTVEGLGQAAHRLVRVRLPGQQDAEVFCYRRPGPWVFVLRGSLGQTGQIPADQAQAVSRRGGDGPEPGVVASEGGGGMGHRRRQLIGPGRERCPDQSGRGGRLGGEEPAVRRKVGADIPNQAEGGSRTVADLGDLGFSQDGRRASIDPRGVGHRAGPARDVLGCCGATTRGVTQELQGLADPALSQLVMAQRTRAAAVTWSPDWPAEARAVSASRSAPGSVGPPASA